jgi:hypothetical protein
MKRSGPPARKSRLERHTKLQPGKRLQSNGNGLVRKGDTPGRGPLRAKSPARAAEEPARAAVRAAVIERDGGCVLRPGTELHAQLVDAGLERVAACFGGPSYHHRRKEGRGGAYSMANGRALCTHHNELLEADATFARWGRQVGLVVRRGDPEWASLGGAHG